MALTSAQLTTFRAAIIAEADSGLVAARSARNDLAIANFYNAEAAGPVKVWRNDVSRQEMMEITVENISIIEALSAGKRELWVLMLGLSVFDFRRVGIRDSATNILGGTTADALFTVLTLRDATRAELLFGTSDVTQGTVTAKVCDFLGTVSVDDVSSALNSQ